ncbi:MAG: hypothetical protein ACJAY8_000179 [Sphingobacteriales bacterium]|jgi:hypothetical protein
MGTTSNLRIHPAIGIARVGNSTEFILSPETMAASPQEGTALTGGLPIKPGTESDTITSNDLRDKEGKLKRQAARFKIYQYQDGDKYTYPAQKSSEVLIGSMLDGKKVKDIVWTAHLANKKANCWEIDEDNNTGIEQYKNGGFPPIRNASFPPSTDPADPARLKKLVIDAGPRVIQTGGDKPAVSFDTLTSPSYWANNGIEVSKDYPVSFPGSDGKPGDYDLASEPITYLGEMQTEANGRLLILGGYGKACGFDNQGNPIPNSPLLKDVDNDNWLDDTADGPVTAVLFFEDGTHQEIEGSAWVVSTDPAYAPQTLNAVSLWDNVYTTWVEQFDLDPSLFSNKKYQPSYQPNFIRDVFPTINSAHMQMWNTSLPSQAIAAHKRILKLGEEKPSFNFLSFIRNPITSKDGPAPLADNKMPFSLGDSNRSFLTVTPTQYFFLEQWSDGKCPGAKTQELQPGEQLDKTILVNCLGGRFSPGIDLTFIVNDRNLYNSKWENPAIGPFRINAEKLDYSKAQKDAPFLGVGYEPLRPFKVQPGDLCKFMAIPWHTDYNSCATHTPAPNPGGTITEENVYSGKVNTTLFWSWPAQRPVSVYTFDDLKANAGELPKQRFSVRGKGSAARQHPEDAGFNTPAMYVGRYQDRVDILLHWHEIGTIMQGPAIDGYPAGFDPEFYLEVESGFKKDESNLVQVWPNTVTDPVFPPKND